jgi:hypothetical protein
MGSSIDRRSLRRGAAVACLLIATIGLAAGLAVAEQSGRPGVLVSLDGSFTPKKLNRDRFSPVSITLKGSVEGTEGLLPPPIGRIDIDFGSNAELSPSGLPSCRRSQLVASDVRHAMAACGPALVGRGEVTAILEFPDSGPHEVQAHLLAFNGHSKEPDAVVWALVSPYRPALATSFVLPFYLQGIPSGGAFGHRIRAPVFHNPARFWRLSRFSVTLGRRYRFEGERRSYLNARCPLPPRFKSLSIPLARATYRFAPAPAVSVNIFRVCRVRD